MRGDTSVLPWVSRNAPAVALAPAIPSSRSWWDSWGEHSRAQAACGLTPRWDRPTVGPPHGGITVPGCGDPTPGEGGVGQRWVSGVRVPHCRPPRLSAQHRHADVIPNQQHRRGGQEQIPSGSLRLCVAVSQIGPRGGLCMRTRRARPRLPAARGELRSSKNKIS